MRGPASLLQFWWEQKTVGPPVRLGLNGLKNSDGLWAKVVVPSCPVPCPGILERGNIDIVCKLGKGGGWSVGSGLVVCVSKVDLQGGLLLSL